MSTDDNVEARKSEKLIYAILISERPIKSQPDLIGYLALAFPEQLAVISPTKFAIHDECTLTNLTYDQWVKPQFKDKWTSHIYSFDKGVRVLPPEAEAHSILEYMMLNLIKEIRPEFATSTAFVRRWSVIDGPQVKEGFFGKSRPTKILAVGVYST